MHKTLSQGGRLVLGAWGCFPSSQTVLNLTSSNTTQGGDGLLATKSSLFFEVCYFCVLPVIPDRQASDTPVFFVSF